MWCTSSLLSLPGSVWPGVVAPDRVLSMGQIGLNCVFMLDWIVWNRTVFDIESVLRLNWIVWIRTVWINWIAWNRNVFLTIKLCTYAKLNCLKLELIICIKMELALNNLQRLMCHKTQTTYSCPLSVSSDRSSRLHPVSIQSCCR